MHVLVVDDNELNRLVAKRMIERSGHLAQTAASGRDALQLLADSSFDVVFIDVEMPGMNGLETTRRIREKFGLAKENGPFITAMTAHSMPGDKERFLSYGMDDYLPKPLSMENIGNAIRRFQAKNTDQQPAAPSPAPSPSAARADTDTLNRKEAMFRFADDEELYLEACQDFLERTPATLAKLFESHESGDFETAMLSAHSIKGNSATIGAEKVATIAHRLEQTLKTRDGNTKELTLQLEAEIAALMPMLEKLTQ